MVATLHESVYSRIAFTCFGTRRAQSVELVRVIYISHRLASSAVGVRIGPVAKGQPGFRTPERNRSDKPGPPKLSCLSARRCKSCEPNVADVAYLNAFPVETGGSSPSSVLRTQRERRQVHDAIVRRLEWPLPDGHPTPAPPVLDQHWERPGFCRRRFSDSVYEILSNGFCVIDADFGRNLCPRRVYSGRVASEYSRKRRDRHCFAVEVPTGT